MACTCRRVPLSEIPGWALNDGCTEMIEECRECADAPAQKETAETVDWERIARESLQILKTLYDDCCTSDPDWGPAICEPSGNSMSLATSFLYREDVKQILERK